MTHKTTSILSHLPATRIQIHTDGSCKGNPGPGGYAAHIRHYEDGDLIQGRIVRGGTTVTTNNRMELEAAVQALLAVSGDEAAPVFILSDSIYVVTGAMVWLAGWKAKNWRNSDKKSVKNADLWRQLDALIDGRGVHFIHVKGHNGDPMNEDVDQIAQGEAERFVQIALEELLASFDDAEALPSVVVPKHVGAAMRIEISTAPEAP